MSRPRIRRVRSFAVVVQSALRQAQTTQVDAISQSIEEKVFEVMHEWPVRVEGRQNSFWVAMDYTDVIVHIFQTELRDFYRLEELWADAPMKKYEFGD